MIRQASPHLSMLETDRQTDGQTDCIHDSSMHKTDMTGAMQPDTTQSVSSSRLFYTYQYGKKGQLIEQWISSVTRTAT